MSTELIIPLDDDRTVKLPEPRVPELRSVFQAFDRVAKFIPRQVEREQFLLTLAYEINKLPADCTAASIRRACLNLAQLGLFPGATLGHAYLVPFRVDRGKPKERKEAQVVIGYKGYLELAYESGHLAGITTEVVLDGEKVRRWNNVDGPQIDHEMEVDRVEDFDKVRAAYCIYRTVGGYTNIVTVPRGRLTALRRRQGNVWKSDPIAMSKKTPVRMAANLWKMTKRLSEALELDRQAEAEQSQHTLVPDGDMTTKKISFDDLPEPEELTGDEQFADASGKVPAWAEGLTAECQKIRKAPDEQRGTLVHRLCESRKSLVPVGEDPAVLADAIANLTEA